MYQLIIFDWDGTIIDSAQKIANSLLASARDVGIPEPTEQAAKGIIGLGLTEAMQALFPDQGAATHQKVVEAYRYHFVTGDKTPQPLFDGIEEGLTALNDAGALLAVATGKSRVGLDRAFKAHDLGRFFAFSRCADETRSKPHPQMLEELLDSSAISPHKAIMIGDTTFDMDMARNANMHGLGAGYGVHSHAQLAESGAQTILNSFNDVIAWLQADKVEKAHG